ncbi:MAG: winged helix-turn-helix domain-containing protein [Candidatus Bathyarchaeia archaeon]
MHKSKLELYTEVLSVLSKKPSTVDSIAYQCNMDCLIIKQRIDFLITNGLVQALSYRGRKVYSLTKRGTAIFKTLTITQRLEKLQTTANTPRINQQQPWIASEHEGEAKQTT